MSAGQINLIVLQRDELLATLKRIMNCSMADPGRGRSNAGVWTTVNVPTTVIKDAKSLIAKVEGT